MRKNQRLNSLWFSFNQQMELYLKVAKNDNHSQFKKDFLLGMTIDKGLPFLFEAPADKNYVGLLVKTKKFFTQTLNAKKMKHFTIEELTTLVTPDSKAELNELVEQLFEDYKNVSARIHLAEMAATGDVELKEALGAKILEVVPVANSLGGEWRTTLPTIEECFSPNADTNKGSAEVGKDAPDAPVAETMVAKVVEEEGVMIVDSPEKLKEFNDLVKSDIEAERKEEASTGDVKTEASSEIEAKKKKSKLTEENVAAIRAELAVEGAKQSEIAKKFNIDPSTVSDIKCNRGRYAAKVETPQPQS